MARQRGQIDVAKHEHWLGILRRWKGSGLSVREFCSRHGLHESQFWFWKRRLADRLDAPTPTVEPTPAFVPITVIKTPTSAADSAIDIHLANGRRVRVRTGCDRQLLADVVALLEGRPC